jgi:hypothetical protein
MLLLICGLVLSILGYIFQVQLLNGFGIGLLTVFTGKTLVVSPAVNQKRPDK